MKCHSPVDARYCFCNTSSGTHYLSYVQHFQHFQLVRISSFPFYSCTNVQHSNHVPSTNSLPRFCQDPYFWHLVSTFPTLSQVNSLNHPYSLDRSLPKYILYLQWYIILIRASRLCDASALRLFMLVSFQKRQSLMVINKSDELNPHRSLTEILIIPLMDYIISTYLFI
jgi:hypothetical protein